MAQRLHIPEHGLGKPGELQESPTRLAFQLAPD